MRKKNMDTIERKIEMTREKLANLEEEYKKVLEERYAKIGKEFYDKFYNCSDFDIFTMTDSQISFFINQVRNCYDAHYFYENETEFRISPIQDEKVKFV